MSLANNEERVIDIGATDHMTFDFKKLENPEACAKIHSIKLPDGSQNCVNYIGNITLPHI